MKEKWLQMVVFFIMLETILFFYFKVTCLVTSKLWIHFKPNFALHKHNNIWTFTTYPTHCLCFTIYFFLIFLKFLVVNKIYSGHLTTKFQNFQFFFFFWLTVLLKLYLLFFNKVFFENFYSYQLKGLLYPPLHIPCDILSFILLYKRFS